MKPYSLLNSREYYNDLRNFLPNGTHHNFNYKNTKVSVCFKSAKDSRIWDIDDNEYLDLCGKYGTLILGHNNKEFNRNFQSNFSNNKVINSELTTISRDVCKLLNETIPGCEMVRFGLSGTEVIQNALRIARAYTNKNKIIRFDGHYHGSDDTILGGIVKDIENPIPIDDSQGAFSTLGRARGALESNTYIIPWNNIPVLEKTLINHNSDIAAIIMEPVCVNGGSIMPDKNYLQHTRQLCDKYNILLIFDEIITGIRMGLGGAQSFYNIIPDLSLWGKCISNGAIPVSLIAGKSKYMNLYTEAKVIHGGTYNGYHLGMVAINSTIQILKKNESSIYKNMNNRIDKIKNIMLSQAKEFKLNLIIQGPSSCSAYHLTDKVLLNNSEFKDDLQFKNGIVRDCLASYGILTAPVSRFFPNISLNDKDVEFFENRIGYALYDAKKIIHRIFR